MTVLTATAARQIITDSLPSVKFYADGPVTPAMCYNYEVEMAEQADEPLPFPGDEATRALFLQVAADVLQAA